MVCVCCIASIEWTYSSVEFWIYPHWTASYWRVNVKQRQSRSHAENEYVIKGRLHTFCDAVISSFCGSPLPSVCPADRMADREVTQWHASTRHRLVQ